MSSDEDKSEYKVGFKKPPLHSRFKPGQSGYPQGSKPKPDDIAGFTDKYLRKKRGLRERTAAGCSSPTKRSSPCRRSTRLRGSDLIIIDDPLTPTQAGDERRRAAVNAWYAAEIAPRLNSEGGTVVVAMQRLHIDDLCGDLLRGPEPWRHVALAAIARRDEA